MSKSMMIVLLVISVIAAAGALFVCVQDCTVTNLLVAWVVVLCAVYFGWQIFKKS